MSEQPDDDWTIPPYARPRRPLWWWALIIAVSLATSLATLAVIEALQG